MSIKSMTGFARISVEGEGYQIQATITSVNGKGAQIKIRTPESYRHLEIPLKKLVLRSISRGSINVSLHIVSDNVAPLRIQTSRLTSFLQSIEDATGSKPAEVSIQDISVIPDIFIEEAEVAEAVIETAIMDVMADVLVEFDEMRSSEGAALVVVLTQHLSEIEAIVADIKRLSLTAVATAMHKMRERVRILLADVEQDIEEADMLREIALLSDKCDINEELDRLTVHIQAFHSALSEARVGKKLDFILQEMNREANTTGSKSIQVEVSQQVISLKSHIESMREQSLNIE